MGPPVCVRRPMPGRLARRGLFLTRSRECVMLEDIRNRLDVTGNHIQALRRRL